MSTFEQQMVRGQLYAQLPVYQRMVRFAQEGIAAMLALCPRTYVSLSFGKQSMVMAHMVWQAAPDTPMYFLASSETWLMHDYADTIRRFLAICPVKLTIVQTNNAAMDITQQIEQLQETCPAIAWWFKTPGDPSWNWKQSRDYGDDDLQLMADRNAFDGWFWGLAKEESKVRAMTLSKTWDGQSHKSIFRYTDGKFRCCPLANWHLHDLAAYIATHDLPMLDAYRRHGLEARTTARATKKSVENGFMGMTRHYNMQALNALCARFPELRGDT